MWWTVDNFYQAAYGLGLLSGTFVDHPALADVPRGTTLRIIATQSAANDRQFPEDDLNAWERLIVLYVGNGHLDVEIDPWFRLGDDDNLVLLAPGPTPALDDDLGIDFAGGGAVTPASFGVLSDGVTRSSCRFQAH